MVAHTIQLSILENFQTYLSLKVSRDNTALNGGASAAGEFNAVAGLGLDLQLHQAKMVSLKFKIYLIIY